MYNDYAPVHDCANIVLVDSMLQGGGPLCSETVALLQPSTVGRALVLRSFEPALPTVDGCTCSVMTGEWASHTIRILQFQVLYGNIPGVQIPIPHPHHTRRPKLHSRTKFQATEKQQEQQQPLEAKHRALLLCPSSVLAEGAKGASSQPAKHE